ncbi:MAG: FAD/NAD(P)-binding protein [Variovorax sp.]
MTIFEAIQKLDLESVKAAIKKDKGAAQARDAPAGHTPLIKLALHKDMHSKAYEQRCPAIVDALLEGHDNELIQAVDFFAGRTALHWATANNNLVFYKALYKHTGLQTWWYHRDLSGKTAVGIAREQQFQELMQEMEAGRSKRVGRGHSTLAIVGVGPAGTAMFIRLVKRLIWSGKRYGVDFLKSTAIHLFDRNAELALGTPYAPQLNGPASILNIAAAGMSIDADQPLDFVLWLKELELRGELKEKLGIAAEIGLCVPSARADGFYPRVVYGSYMKQRLAEWIKAAQQAGIEVHEYPNTEVTGVAPDAKSGGHLIQTDGKTHPQVSANFIYYTTGHFKEAAKKPPQLAYLDDADKAIVFPDNGDALEKAKMFDMPGDVAVIGSSLSAVDAIFTILLNKKVGTLHWEGNKPTYLPLHKDASGHPTTKVTCYSRKGLFSKVRPESNKDLDLEILNPGALEWWRSHWKKHMTLAELVAALELELTKQLGKPVTVGKLADPLSQPDAPHRDPFTYLKEDIQWAEDGDGSAPDRGYVQWYQVMHSLFSVVRPLYRNFTPADRKAFDAKYNSNWLWAFAPMPAISGKVLLAMHAAGALDLHRIAPDATPVWKDGFEVSSFDYENKAQQKKHRFLCYTAGLATRFGDDPSPLTQGSIVNSDFVFSDPYASHDEGGPEGQTPEASAWIADDGTFEIAERKDGKLERSPARRGVGFFLRAQMLDVQAVPSVVKYGTQVAELYYDDIVHRLGRSVVTGGDLPKP